MANEQDPLLSQYNINEKHANRDKAKHVRAKLHTEWRKAVKRSAKKIERSLAKHVDSKRGMTNKLLQSMTFSVTDVMARCRLAKQRVLRHEPHASPRRPEAIKWSLVPAFEPELLQHKAPPKALANNAQRLFKGVYCADELPYDLLRSRKSFSIIVNLATRSKKVTSRLPPLNGHFVFITTKDFNMYYCDPFGLECYHPYVLAFLNAFKEKKSKKTRRRQVFHSNRRIQSPNSVYCGLFTLLFAMIREANLDLSDFEFDEKNLNKNDKKCVDYINLMLNAVCT
jgi:hypothetical protein